MTKALLCHWHLLLTFFLLLLLSWPNAYIKMFALQVSCWRLNISFFGGFVVSTVMH